MNSPLPFSTITLSDQQGVSRLLATAESNPKLIKWCRSINWPEAQRLPFAENELLSLMSNLHRFVTMQTSWRLLKSLPDVNMTELALPGITFSELCRYRYGFTNLERLVVRSIYTYFSEESYGSAIKNLLTMPRLTHLVIASLDLQHLIQAIIKGSFDGLAAHVEHTPRSCRVIFVVPEIPFLTWGGYGLRNGISKPSECRGVQMIFLTYGTQFGDGASGWLRDRIVDGTFWEKINLEKYRDPEHYIEVHYL
jgi:hypothetical protein